MAVQSGAADLVFGRDLLGAGIAQAVLVELLLLHVVEVLAALGQVHPLAAKIAANLRFNIVQHMRRKVRGLLAQHGQQLGQDVRLFVSVGVLHDGQVRHASSPKALDTAQVDAPAHAGLDGGLGW